MKTKLIIATSLLILKSTLSFSQKDSSGIYFTVNDYVKRTLSFAINCKTQKHKIKSNLIFHPKAISIKHGDSTYTYSKDSVYGIRYCDGSMVRIYDNKEYPLINPYEEIVIYKIVSGPPGKGSLPMITYYFSKNAGSNIQELTIYNLKAAFPDNHKFHDLVDMEFHNNDELIVYDSFHKCMKVNHVFNLSLQK